MVAIGGGGFIPARMLRTEVRVPILAVSLELYDDVRRKAEGGRRGWGVRGTTPFTTRAARNTTYPLAGDTWHTHTRPTHTRRPLTHVAPSPSFRAARLLLFFLCCTPTPPPPHPHPTQCTGHEHGERTGAAEAVVSVNPSYYTHYAPFVHLRYHIYTVCTLVIHVYTTIYTPNTPLNTL